MLHNLFAMPVGHTSIDPNSYNKKYIIDTIEQNYLVDKNRNSWSPFSRLHHWQLDKDNSKFKEIDYSELFPIYTKEINNFFTKLSFSKNFNWSFNVTNYTCMTSTQYMHPHNHTNCDFNAIHYIKFHEEHAPTHFVNTHSHADYLGAFRPHLFDLLDSTDVSNSWAAASYYFGIKEDDFVIVPGVLKHFVPEQTSDETRMTVVLNINLSP